MTFGATAPPRFPAPTARTSWTCAAKSTATTGSATKTWPVTSLSLRWRDACATPDGPVNLTRSVKLMLFLIRQIRRPLIGGVFSRLGVDCSVAVDNCAGGQPCQNNGTCSSTTDSYRCECPRGFTGSHCQHRVDYCAGSPCLNGGSCVGDLDGFRYGPGSFFLTFTLLIVTFLQK